jgi:hypothetical protein
MKLFSIEVILVLNLATVIMACGMHKKILICCEPNRLIRSFDCCCSDKDGSNIIVHHALSTLVEDTVSMDCGGCDKYGFKC